MENIKIKERYKFLLVGLIILVFIAYLVLNRVLAFDLGANFAIGQANMTSGTANAGGSVSADGYDYQFGLASDGTHVFVSDCSNNRVLVYNSVPTTSGQPADVVIGQPDMISNADNQASASAGANTLNCPTFLDTDGTRLFIVDSSNSRVLIYNHIPTTNNASADVVIGQPNMTSHSVNQGGSVNSNTLNSPQGVSFDRSTGRLLVTDYSNHRVLIYSWVPTYNNHSANVVVGQPNMTSNSANQGGSADANTLSYPFNARILNDKLLIADQDNHRVLIYNSIPAFNNASASAVIGQPDMTSHLGNQGGGSTPAANTLRYPEDILWDGSKLLIQDDSNDRVLVFNGIPTTNDASAVDALGAPDLTSDNYDTTANRFGDPEGELAQAGTTLLVGDSSNNRVVGFNNFLSSPPADTNPSQFANTDFVTFPAAGTTYVLDMVKVGNILYFGGYFTEVCNADGVTCFARDGLAAIDTTTGEVTGWAPDLQDIYGGGIGGNGQGEVDALAYNNNNNTLYVGGYFTGVNGATRSALAAFDTTTGDLLPWAPIASNDDYVIALEVYNSKLYVGGFFGDIDANPRHNLASFDIATSTGELTSWAPPSDENGVLKIRAYNGVVYVGGYFLTMGCLSSSGCPTNGENRNSLAAFNACDSNGFLTNFAPNFSSSPYDMAFWGDTMYVGGEFDTVNGDVRIGLAAINLATTGALLPWNPTLIDAANNQSTEALVDSLKIKDGNLYISGAFSNIDSNVRQSIASFDLSDNSLNAWEPNASLTCDLHVILPTDNYIYVDTDGCSIRGNRNEISLARFNYTTPNIPTPSPAPSQDNSCIQEITPTPTDTPTPTPTLTPTPTPTPTGTLIPTPTNTPTPIPTPTGTLTPTPTSTLTPTPSATLTPTNTLTPTATIGLKPGVSLVTGNPSILTAGAIGIMLTVIGGILMLML